MKRNPALLTMLLVLTGVFVTVSAQPVLSRMEGPALSHVEGPDRIESPEGGHYVLSQCFVTAGIFSTCPGLILSGSFS